MRKLIILLSALVTGCLGFSQARAQEADTNKYSLNLHEHESRGFCLDSVGGEFAFAAEHSDRGFRMGEAFVTFNVPLGLHLGRFEMNGRLDAGAGWLGRSDDNAAMVGLGPAVIFKYRGIPISLEVGGRFTYVSQHEFGSFNISTDFQFTEYGGFNWDITRHWRLGYRFTHISNAGIKDPNPGLNFHGVIFSYLF